MSFGMSRMLGLNRRLPDTTMRDTLVRVDPEQLRRCIHRQVKAAQRRKALRPEGLPFGVVAIDGKSTAIETWDMAFEEDDRPWIRNAPRGTLVVMLLRRMAFNMPALFRSVTQRSEEKRRTPLKDIMRWMHHAVVGIEVQELGSLRPRNAGVG